MVAPSRTSAGWRTPDTVDIANSCKCAEAWEICRGSQCSQAYTDWIALIEDSNCSAGVARCEPYSFEDRLRAIV
jgi:acyl-CoA-binding protein